MRALVVEDTPDLARLVQRVLVLEGFKVEIAADGASALAIVRDAPPDLIILDLMLPDIDGREICRRIRAADDAADRPPTPILMLTALSTVADRVAGFEAGADDYLPKPFDVKELALRVRALMRRVQEPRAAPALATDVLRFENLVVDLGSRAVVRGERPVRLTAREFDLLALFMRHPNQVLPHALVLERVWGRDTLGDSNVLPVTIGTLRQALEADGESRLIQTVRGVGYVLRAA